MTSGFILPAEFGILTGMFLGTVIGISLVVRGMRLRSFGRDELFIGIGLLVITWLAGMILFLMVFDPFDTTNGLSCHIHSCGERN